MTFPQDPSDRRIVIPLNDHDYRRIDADGDLKTLAGRAAVTVLRLPFESSQVRENPIVQALQAADMLKSGAALIQNPRRADAYVPALNAIETLAHEKCAVCAEVSQRLGATSVEIADFETITEGRSTRWTLDARHNLIGPTLAAERTEAEKFLRSLVITCEFDGGEPNLDAARELLDRAGLSRDGELAALVRLRGEQNPLRHRKVKMATADESAVIRNWLGAAVAPLNRLAVGRTTSELGRTDCVFELDVSFSR